MSELETRLNLANLPKPRSLQIIPEYPKARLLVDLATVDGARAWAAALGIRLHPTGRFMWLRQESGSATFGVLRVQVVGTEALEEATAELADPDLSAASAAWHAAHPGEYCPNWLTCGECKPGAPALVNGTYFADGPDDTPADPADVEHGMRIADAYTRGGAR